jgi:isopentenyldiphosphate isomerase
MGSTEELVQVVDENDVPLYGATKSEIQTKGLWYRVARIMVVNTAGQILVQKRAPDKKLFPDRWDNSAAGHVGVGEAYLVAAEREMSEEVGISGVTLRKLGHYASTNVSNLGVLYEHQDVYEAMVGEEVELNLQEDEVSGAEWMSRQNLRLLVTEHPESCTPGLVDVVSQFYTP